MHQRHRWFRSGSVVLLAVIAGVMPAVAAEHVVDQVGLTFVPDEITVTPGDTVRWVWSGGSHTVTSGSPCTPDGLFNSPLTSAVPEFVWAVPETLGDVPYYCIPHCAFGMTGVIHVTAPPLEFVITVDGDQVVPAIQPSGVTTFEPPLGYRFARIQAEQSGASFEINVNILYR